VTPRDGTRGRPGQGVQPAQLGSQSAGALASSRAARQARIDQHRCVILATNARDTTPLPPQQLLEGDNGQTHGEHGVRFVKDPELLASSRYLKKPGRIMVLLMVMTVCWLV
jgi:transposase